MSLTTMPVAGASALVPQNMQDAMRMAEMMAKTGFLARELQTPGGALFVMEQAMRWNMSPFSVAMEVSFISGKPMFSGKIVAAAVQSSGVLAGRLRYDYAGAGDTREITVTGTIRGEDAPRSVTVKLNDAKTNNQHWKGQPDQMLAYHGARVWARRHAPEVMLGVYSPEEMEEAPQPAMPPARGPQIDGAAGMTPPERPAWGGMAWPVCDRRGTCTDLLAEDAWMAEVQKRVAHIQTLSTLDDAMKHRTITQIAEANRDAWAELRERGQAAAVEEAEGILRAALGATDGDGFPGDAP